MECVSYYCTAKPQSMRSILTILAVFMFVSGVLPRMMSVLFSMAVAVTALGSNALCGCAVASAFLQLKNAMAGKKEE